MSYETNPDQRRREQGFALVALVLVLAIVAILVAVSTTGLTRPTATATSAPTVAPVANALATANTTGCAGELRTVQLAMDSMMVSNGVTFVTAQTTATRTFTNLPVGTGTRPLVPGYLRQDTTRGSYVWTSDGSVSAAATGACP